uniref:Uncharacterized protein n=1 Tax=Corethron hystrix TaxID=216773 RepID=A0A7S1FXB3_9STRA|mmetsp:Transcript_35035/g.81016  ORF Transcript_35035/g.81016 Transcript_35035/m.81016 type:complete len:430 (+) Transcript_35035:81-1370(+)
MVEMRGRIGISLFYFYCLHSNEKNTSSAFVVSPAWPHRHPAKFQLRAESEGFHPSENTFDVMKKLDVRLEALERSAPDSLAGFYEADLHSFSVRPGSRRFSVTSTLFSLEAVASARQDLFGSVADLDLDDPSGVRETSGGKISLRRVLEATLASDWNEHDLFQVPLLVHVLLSMDGERTLLGPRAMDEVTADRLRRLISALLASRPKRRNGSQQPLSEYLIFLVARAMATLNDSATAFKIPEIEGVISTGNENESAIGVGGLPAKALPDGASSQLSLGLSRCCEVGQNELCRQLAYKISGDTGNFDITRLAYSLLTYTTSAKAMSGTAGIELIPGEGPTVGSVVGPANKKLMREALKAFFDEQNEDGLWDKGQPIYKTFRKTGRNVGNAFVFSTDTLGSLLEYLPAEYFRPHLGRCRGECHRMPLVVIL